MTSSARAERGATRVAIIGLGAIGGSAALKLLERGAVPSGFSADQDDRALARTAGVAVGESVAACVKDADLVLLAVPLDELAGVAREALAAAPAHATILHACGLQRPDATRLDRDHAARIIGTHPMAGTEQSGFAAASADLFRGATVIAEDRGDRQTRDDVELFWSMAGAGRVEYRQSGEHDDFVSAASHVPQIVATALAATLSYAAVPRSRLGPGGRDMTRLAASPWSMWRPLLAASPGRTLALLETMESELRTFREGILKGALDDAGVTWTAARGWALEEQGKPPA